MTRGLRDTYQQIARDYLSKKTRPWEACSQFLSQINWNPRGTVVDIGTGNGRNLSSSTASLHIGIDLSVNLLYGFIGPSQTQRIAGVIPQLPLRRNVADSALAIAVLHHLPTRAERINALRSIQMICQSNASVVLSVWRKWRTGKKEVIFERIKKNVPIDDLVDEMRPWRDSEGNVLGYRYYHHFTRKELLESIAQTNLILLNCIITGGKHEDANFFVYLSTK
ncbi:MAG: class I SAM-dependent methyltransferase [Candidatus Kariarchaeaceae archaeon]